MADSGPGYYAFLKSNVVVNVVKAESDFINAQISSGAIDAAVLLGEGVRPSIGYRFDGTNFLPPLISIYAARAMKLTEFKLAIQAYVNERYSIDDRIQLMNMYTIAKEDGLTNRAAYLRQGLTWGNTIAAYAASFKAAVDAETDPQTVLNMNFDVASNFGPDPQVKAGVANQIMD